MTRSRLLTDQERDRFASWLEQEASDGEAMAKQIETMTKGAGPVLALAKKERAEALAARVIAAKLRSIQSETNRGMPPVKVSDELREQFRALSRSGSDE